MSFDIVDYYSSISEGLFCEALNWTKSSLLFDGKDFWKKSGGSDFDIQMSSWDSAESTDVVGMFLLNKVNQIKVNNYGVSGKLYRDDGLMATRMTPRLNKNGVLWSQTRMRIEMRLRCFFGFLVIGNL